MPRLAGTAAAVAAPFGIAIAMPRSARRDVGVYALQMWAYIVTHELPYEDPARLERRVHVAYPIACDRRLFGSAPTVALQRALARPDRVTALDHFLVYIHWAWFLQPHMVSAWLLWRHRERFPRAALMICAVFDLGLVGYFVVPTAPPWWAAERGRIKGMRRIMVDVGGRLWGRLWEPLYGFLGGNPLAAMPSLHFASSVMAAHMLAEVGPLPAAIGWSYAGTLGFALIYLGEHYLVDLAAGLALVEAIRWLEPRVERPVLGVAQAVQALEARAAT